MKNFLYLILILFSCNAFAANGSGNVSSVVGFGGIETNSTITTPETNPLGYFTIAARLDGGAAAGTVAPFFKNGVKYQVTAGKTCKIVKLLIVTILTGPVQAQLVWANATFSNGDSAATFAALSGASYQNGQSGNYLFSSTSPSAPFALSMPVLDFPASSFPGIQEGSVSGQGTVWLLVKEI